MSSEIPYVLGVCPTCNAAHSTRFVGFPDRNGANTAPLPEEHAYRMGEHTNQYARHCAGSGALPARLLSAEHKHAAA